MENPLIGKRLKAIYLSDGGGAIRFDLDDGKTIVARAACDCCSHTWIEHVESPSHVIGATVTNVEDVDMPTKEYDKYEYDCLRFYGCKIITDKGSFTIDYRNSSNGYYGGSLEWSDSNFYGGVFGQNGKVGEWKEVK